MARRYVTYGDVAFGLNTGRWGLPWITPTDYIQELKSTTGLSDAKIAHDLSADCGLEVTKQTVNRWRKM